MKGIQPLKTYFSNPQRFSRLKLAPKVVVVVFVFIYRDLIMKDGVFWLSRLWKQLKHLLVSRWNLYPSFWCLEVLRHRDCLSFLFFFSDDFFLFSRRSYLQLLSSDLRNSSFLISHLPAESVFFFLYFCIMSFLLMCHTVFRYAVTHSPSTCAYDTKLYLKSFCLLGPCVKFPHLLSSCPSSVSTFTNATQWLLIPKTVVHA